MFEEDQNCLKRELMERIKVASYTRWYVSEKYGRDKLRCLASISEQQKHNKYRAL